MERISHVGLIYPAGKSYWRESLSTVDLLVPASLDQLLSLLRILFFFYKTSKLNEKVNCTQPSPSVSIACTTDQERTILSITTLRIMTLSIICSFGAISVNDTQHNDTVQNSIKWHNAESRCAEYCILIIMLSVIMLSAQFSLLCRVLHFLFIGWVSLC